MSIENWPDVDAPNPLPSVIPQEDQSAHALKMMWSVLDSLHKELVGSEVQRVEMAVSAALASVEAKARAAVAAHHAQEIARLKDALTIRAETLAMAHARKQADADGFQRGWHAALARVAEGDPVRDLAGLVPIIDERVRERLEAAEADVARAMKVLAPNMPESGLEDACRQVVQAKVSAIGNCETLEAQLANLTETLQINESQRQTIAQLQQEIDRLRDAYRRLTSEPVEKRTRIETRCPSCGNATLFIGSNGHLTCSWLKCQEPGVEFAVESLRQTLEAQRQEIERLKQAHQWQPIETAPKDIKCWFWLRPKAAEETYHDTSGHPILANAAPYADVTKFGWWGSLWTATHWRPYIIPTPPADPSPKEP